MYISSVNYQASDAAEAFADSLVNTGFGVLENHPVDMSLVNSVYKEWQDFFADEAKHSYIYNKETQDGYFPFLSENAKDQNVKDLKEFYHFYPWGKFPQGLSGGTSKLYHCLSLLAAEILDWLERQTPSAISRNFVMPLSQMIKDSPRTLLRILHYPPLTGAEDAGAIRAAAHEDINLITLLPAATARGLQVQDKQGNWHDVECDASTIIINAGDMLQMCSQGYYKSTTHRVMNPTDESRHMSRLSMPLFLHPQDDVPLSETHTANSYRLERLREIGLL